ncbi:MAG: hypothetical protein AABY07_06205 [Nanoarchaeota archaeon]
MLIPSKRGGITKIVVWIIILLVIIGAIYMTYKYVSKDRSSSNENNNLLDTSGTQDSGMGQNVNAQTSDTEKPPVPPE